MAAARAPLLPRQPSAATATAARSVHETQQQQYAAALKHSFQRVLSKSPGITDAAGWAELYVKLEAQLAALARSGRGAVEDAVLLGERASFKAGYALWYSHTLDGGVLRPILGARAAYDREAEERAWVGFCVRTGRDSRSEAQVRAQAHAAAVLREERNAPAPAPAPAPARAQRRGVKRPPVAAAEAPEAPLFPLAPDTDAAALEAPVDVYADSFGRALAGGAMRGWPRFHVPAPPRAVVDAAILAGSSVRVLGPTQTGVETVGTQAAFAAWVERLGLNRLSGVDVRRLKEQREAVGACPYARARRDCALVPLDQGTYNSVWIYAPPEGTPPLSVAQAEALFFPAVAATMATRPESVVFRVPLAEDARKPTYSLLTQAADEIANMADAAHAGFGVALYAAAVIRSDAPARPRRRTEPASKPDAQERYNYRVCAVLHRGTASCDRRVAAMGRLAQLRQEPQRRDWPQRVRAYFEAVNNAVWVMSLKRRLNLDIKMANLVDTFAQSKPFDGPPGSIFVIDFDSTTYHRLPLGEALDGSDEPDGEDEPRPAPPEAQGWRPVYLYNVLVLSAQLRLLVTDAETYHHMWWSWLRAPIATLLAQVRAGDGYDEEFRTIAAFVRDLKWTGSLPGRELPECSDVESPRATAARLAEAYVGYYMYGAYTGHLSSSGESNLQRRVESIRTQVRGLPDAARLEREAVAAWYDAQYRRRIAPLVRFFADRRDSDRASASSIVDVLFEFADAPWDQLVRTFVDAQPARRGGAALRCNKEWQPLITGEKLAARVWSVPSGPSAAWECAAHLADAMEPPLRAGAGAR